MPGLCRACVLGCFCEDSAPIKRVVNDLPNGRRLRIHIHAITCFEVSDNTFGGDFQSHARQLRVASRLNMIDSE